jgi:hypothetical protein
VQVRAVLTEPGVGIEPTTSSLQAKNRTSRGSAEFSRIWHLTSGFVLPSLTSVSPRLPVQSRTFAHGSRMTLFEGMRSSVIHSP